MKVKKMMTIAIFVSLSAVLSYIRIFQMPNGGSISLYLVPLMFVAFKMDFKSSFICCFIGGIMQIFIEGFILGFFQIFLDYIIPVTAISLFSLIKTREYKTLIPYSIFIGLIMYISYVTSGIVYFKVNFVGSLIYNATYFVPTYIVSMIIILILDKINYET